MYGKQNLPKLLPRGKSYTISARVAMTLLLCALVWNTPLAQTLPQEYANLIRSQQNVGPLGVDLLGDTIDFNTGQVTFVTTDVSLPGNNSLPVSLTRRHTVEANPTSTAERKAFGDWDIDLPRIDLISANPQ